MDCASPPITVDAPGFATGKCLVKRRLFHRHARGQGQTTVEFAFICLPFFAILFAIIDFAQIYFYENSLQNAMREAARFSTAGRIIQATNNDGSLAYETNTTTGVVLPKAINDSEGREASREECTRYWFLSNCVLAIPLSNIVITSAPTLAGVPPTVSTNSLGQLTLLSGYNVSTNQGTVSTNAVAAIKGPGDANDYIQVTATYYVSTITPLFSYVGGYSRQGWNIFPAHVSAIVKNEPALLNFEHTNIYGDEP